MKTKKQMFLVPSIKFFIDKRGLLLMEMKGIHYAENYMYITVKMSKIQDVPKKLLESEEQYIAVSRFSSVFFRVSDKRRNKCQMQQV